MLAYVHSSWSGWSVLAPWGSASRPPLLDLPRYTTFPLVMLLAPLCAAVAGGGGGTRQHGCGCTAGLQAGRGGGALHQRQLHQHRRRAGGGPTQCGAGTMCCACPALPACQALPARPCMWQRCWLSGLMAAGPAVVLAHRASLRGLQRSGGATSATRTYQLRLGSIISAAEEPFTPPANPPRRPPLIPPLTCCRSSLGAIRT